MTRTVIGGIAAGAFTLGILAGLVIPGSLAASRHDQLMASHWSALGSVPMMDWGSMPMMQGRSMPMMDSGSMMGAGSVPMGHAMHHGWWELGR
jgi:hypothetical protein